MFRVAKEIIVATSLVCAIAANAHAQSTDVGVTVAGLISFQPADGSYVGSPYLNEGVGGFAPVLSAGGSGIFPNNLVVAVEFTSRAEFATVQRGRLVPRAPDERPNEGGSGTTELKNSLVAVMAGYAHELERRKLLFLLGGALTREEILHDGVVIENERRLPFDLSAGFDLLQQVSSRLSLGVSARYTHASRSRRLEQFGIGQHILRVGAVIRLRFN